jgi:hypothetical protein
MTRPLLACAALALASLGTLPAAQAGTHAAVVINAGAPAPMVAVQYGPPPPPRYEVVPAPRRGMVWVAGHWEWRGHRHVWVNGYWVRTRPGYHYRQPVWVEHGGRWEWRGGGWDRDGDGVPNRYDRHPDNPYRR